MAGGAGSFNGFPTGKDANSGGTVTSVTGAAPITSTGGVTPQIGITPATTSDPGSMSAADKTKLEGLGATSEIAGSALAVAKPVYTAASGKMLALDGTEQAVRFAFAGMTTTSAGADTNPVTVAPNGIKSTGHVGLTIGQGYYISSGVLIAQADLAAFVSGAASGTWYRFLGTASATTTIKQVWGEPQQVP